MLFWTDKPESNGPKVEAKVRKEFGSTTPLPYDVQVQGQYRPKSVGQFVGDVAGDAVFELFGFGGTKPLYSFDFQIASPRAVALRVPVIKSGNAIVLGALVYTAPISNPVPAEVTLEDQKVFGKSKFTGDPATIAKLNANGDLLKRVNQFARTEYTVGKQVIKAKRYVKLTPNGATSVLTIGTQPRATWFGLGSSFEAQQFLAIASAIEASL